jgi:hypothetical protein
MSLCMYFVPRLLISIAYDFYDCTEFPSMWNSTIFLLVLDSYVGRSNILFQLRIKCVVTTIAIYNIINCTRGKSLLRY